MAPAKVTGIGIHVKVADIGKSRQFYESLGLRAVYAFGDDEFRASLPKDVAASARPSRHCGIIFAIGENAQLEIADGHPAVSERSTYTDRIATPKVSAMIHVDSLVPLFSNPLVEIKFPVRRYYWGTIECAFRDPDGFVLVFIAPFSEDEYNRVSQLTNIETIDPQPQSA
jgi:catechol 2,3-dioxygenase-like lactoylglutathione lyase family enzyme